MVFHFLNFMVVTYAGVKYGTAPQKSLAGMTNMAHVGSFMNSLSKVCYIHLNYFLASKGSLYRDYVCSYTHFFELFPRF